jgi:hypothetical protein
VQLPPFSRHFIPLRSIYSPQHPVLKHPSWVITCFNNATLLLNNIYSCNYNYIPSFLISSCIYWF